MTLTKKPSGIYHASFRTADGRTRTITTRTKDKAEAKKIVATSKLKELEHIAKADRLTHEAIVRLTAGRKLTVQKALGQWRLHLETNSNSPRTAKNYVDSVAAWMRDSKTADRPTTAIIESDIDQWLNDPESKSKVATRRWMRAGLNQFFIYCAAHNWVLRNPVTTVKIRYNVLTHEQKETTVRECFTEAELRQLLTGLMADAARVDAEIARLTEAEAHANTLEPHYYRSRRLIFWAFAVQISWEIGLRLGDIAQLEWASFMYPGKATVHTDKSNRRVQVPISARVSDALCTIPVLDARYLFPEECKTALDPVKRAALSVEFGRLLKRHGIKGKSFHCLRHAAISRWAKAGTSLEQIAKDVGHGSTQTTQGYIHP